MTAEGIELVLEHDGRDWRVHGADLTARAITLPALDRVLMQALAANGRTDPVTVHMRFDGAALPGWIRQYMSHYFNRTVRLQPQAAASAP